MENEKLVTVAIHTYEKAEILKSILEAEGIPAMIHNVSMVQPVVSSGVRVRINENNLPKALEIIENFNASMLEKVEKAQKKISPRKEILVPIDFSQYTMKTCQFAFKLAKVLNCHVKLFHAYFSAFYPAAIPFGESFTIQTPDEEVYKNIHDNVEREMKKVVDQLNEAIASQQLPAITFSYLLQEGLPEEEIVDYSKKMRPMAIVMGTRGKHEKELDLIGSVTAEVIDGSKSPVFAIPEAASLTDIASLKKVMFLTNFREHEFNAFDTMMKMVSDQPLDIHFVHIEKRDDEWNEIKLSGLMTMLKEKYATIEADFSIIEGTHDFEDKLEALVNEKSIDIIAMSSSRRTIFARLFNPGIARRMLFHSNIPLLVIKG